jgi:ribonuclease HI
MEIEQEIVVTYDHWHNSTQSEIVAIIVALLTAPSRSHVTIYSDSLNAIRIVEEIQSDYLDNRIHPRKYFKIRGVPEIS